MLFSISNSSKDIFKVISKVFLIVHHEFNVTDLNLHLFNYHRFSSRQENVFSVRGTSVRDGLLKFSMVSIPLFKYHEAVKNYPKFETYEYIFDQTG